MCLVCLGVSVGAWLRDFPGTWPSRADQGILQANPRLLGPGHLHPRYSHMSDGYHGEGSLVLTVSDGTPSLQTEAVVVVVVVVVVMAMSVEYHAIHSHVALSRSKSVAEVKTHLFNIAATK